MQGRVPVLRRNSRAASRSASADARTDASGCLLRGGKGPAPCGVLRSLLGARSTQHGGTRSMHSTTRTAQHSMGLLHLRGSSYCVPSTGLVTMFSCFTCSWNLQEERGRICVCECMGRGAAAVVQAVTNQPLARRASICGTARESGPGPSLPALWRAHTSSSWTGPSLPAPQGLVRRRNPPAYEPAVAQAGEALATICVRTPWRPPSAPAAPAAPPRRPAPPASPEVEGGAKVSAPVHLKGGVHFHIPEGAQGQGGRGAVAGRQASVESETTRLHASVRRPCAVQWGCPMTFRPRHAHPTPWPSSLKQLRSSVLLPPPGGPVMTWKKREGACRGGVGVEGWCEVGGWWVGRMARGCRGGVAGAGRGCTAPSPTSVPPRNAGRPPGLPARTGGCSISRMRARSSCRGSSGGGAGGGRTPLNSVSRTAGRFEGSVTGGQGSAMLAVSGWYLTRTLSPPLPPDLW